MKLCETVRLCLSSLALLTLATAGLAQEPAKRPNIKRPNILWFFVDDMSANFSCYGERTIQTPHVDRLAAQGVRFTHAFVTAPVCSPCRSALITGMYQTSIGAHQHRSGRGELKINLPQGVQPIPELFQAAGYYTCIGDGLSASKPARGGGRGLGKTDYNFQYRDSMYDANDWSGRRADQPFFMQVQLAGGKLRGGTDAAAQKLSARAAEVFGTAVTPDQVTLPPYYPRSPIILRDWAAYLDSVRLTDQHVGDVLARLQREGLLEDTLVIFMTDHGISHARGKQFLYDEGTHVPLVIRAPRNFPQLLSSVAPGTVRDDLVEHFDLAALSLAAAGIEVPATMHARNILASDYRPRQAIFAARDRCDETIERLRSVRTEQYLYIRNFYPDQPHLQPNAYKDGKSILQELRALHASGQLPPLSEQLLFAPKRPSEELYAWPSDPWQINNLADKLEHAETMISLRKQLDQWITQTGDHGAESEAMYDSDMAVYLERGNPTVERNIQLMKSWAYPKP